MYPQKVWTISRPLQEGEHLSFNGSVIIKSFVPDFVRIDVENGGIVLEAGGGSNLTLTTRENLETLETESAADAAESIFRSVFNRQRLYSQHGGILSQRSLGDNVTLISDRAIKLSDIGTNATINTPADLDAHDIGRGAKLDVGGDIDVLEIGTDVRARAGGYVYANNIGARCQLDAGRFICSQNIGPKSVLRAGEYIRGNHVAENTILISSDRVSLTGFANNVHILDGGITKLRSTDDVFDAGHGNIGEKSAIRLTLN